MIPATVETPEDRPAPPPSVDAPIVLVCGLANLLSLLPPETKLDPGHLRKDMEEQQNELREKGYIVHDLCTLIPDVKQLEETAIAPFRKAVEATKPDLIVIGSSIRVQPKMGELVEEMLNIAVGLFGKKVRFAFSSSTKGTVEAVQRVLPL